MRLCFVLFFGVVSGSFQPVLAWEAVQSRANVITKFISVFVLKSMASVITK